MVCLRNIPDDVSGKQCFAGVPLIDRNDVLRSFFDIKGKSSELPYDTNTCGAGLIGQVSGGRAERVSTVWPAGNETNLR